MVRHLGGPGQPPIEERRAAAAVDRVDRRDEELGIGYGGGWHHHLHLVIEGNDRQPIAGGEFTSEEAGSLAGIAELAAAHRSGAIDHQRQVQGRPGPALLLLARFRSGDGEQEIECGGAISRHRRPQGPEAKRGLGHGKGLVVGRFSPGVRRAARSGGR